MSLAQSQATIQISPDVLLSFGDKAPYYGVLVNPQRYRMFSIDHKERVEILDHLDEKLASAQPPLISSSGWSQIGWLGMGLVLGLALGFSFGH